MGGTVMREAEAKEAFQLSSDGTSLEITGPRLSGKTTVLQKFSGWYHDAGQGALVLHGVGATLSGEAFRAALRPAASNSSGAASSSGVIQRVAELKLRVIIVDDADRLDDASWDLVRLAHRTLGIPIVSATSGGAGAQDRSLSGIALGYQRITLDPLGIERVHDLLQEHLQGRVSPTLASRIHTMSGGVLGLVIAITDAALRGGKIRKANGLWIDSPDLWDDSVATTYEALLDRLTDAQREALESLAILGASKVSIARELIGGASLESLEREGKARVFVTDGQARVAVNPPGVANYFAHLPMSMRRLRLLDQLSRKAGTALSAGHRGPPPIASADRNDQRSRELPFIARMFSDTRAFQWSTALREWESNRSVGTAIEVLCLHLSSGDTERRIIDRVLAETPLHDASADDELIFRYLRSRWALRLGVKASTITAELTADCVDAYEFGPALEALAIAVEMERDSITGQHLVRLREFAMLPGRNGDVGRIVLGYALIFGCRAREALEVLGTPDADTSEFFAAQCAVVYGLALYSCGEFDAARQWAARHVDRSISQTQRVFLAGHSFVAGLAEATLGRFETTGWSVHIALSSDISGDGLLFSPDRALLNLMAVSAFTAGRENVAESFTERANVVLGGSDAIPFGALEFVNAAREARNGNAGAAAATYRSAARRLRDRGYSLAADQAVMLSLVTKFDADIASDFREAALTIGGAFYGAYLDGQRALLEEDSAALVETSRILRSFGETDSALRLLTHAIRILGGAGRSSEAEDVRVEMRAILDGPTGHSEGALSGIGLTAREQQLLVLLAGGLSNADIARQLNIGVRTVDTHLRNIRKKTGSVAREDLARLSKAD